MPKNAVCIDVMNLLSANGFGTIGTNLFAMAWGDDVDSQVMVMDSEGFETTLKTDLDDMGLPIAGYEQPTFRVLVRGNKGEDMNTAYTAIRNIHEFLIVQTTTTDYLQYEPISTILTLGRDDNDRAVFSSRYYTFRNPI